MNLLEAIAWVEQQPPGTKLQSECGNFRLVNSGPHNAGVYLAHFDSESGWGSTSSVDQAAKATWPRPRRKVDYLAALRVVKSVHSLEERWVLGSKRGCVTRRVGNRGRHMIRTENGFRKGSTPTRPGDEICPNRAAFLAELAEKRKRLKKSKYPLGDYESEEQRQADVDAVMASLRSDGRDAAMSTPAEQDEARTRYAIRRDEIRKQINALLAEGKSLVEIAKTLGLEKNDGPVCDND